MADNVAITAGSGTTVHADEYTHTTLGSGKTQLVKLVDGTLDSDAAIAVDVGVKANALRVAPANDITDETYIGDIKFGESLPAGTNAIGKLAANTGVDIGDVDITSIAAGDNNIGNVDIVTVPAPLSTTGGGTEATALRVTIANDSSGVVSVDDGGGTLTVDGTVTANLSATDNAVLDVIAADTSSMDGKMVAGEGVITAATQRVTLATDDDSVAHLATIAGAVSTQMQCDVVAALPAGDNNIGNVDVVGGTVTTVSTVTNLAQMGGAALNMGEGAIDTGTQRVTLATDDDGVAHLATIAGDTTSLDGKVTACNTGAVVISSGSCTVDLGSNNDVVCAGDTATDAVDSGNPVKVGGRAVNIDGTAPGTAVAEADRADFITDVYGRQCVETSHPNLWSATANYAAAQTDTELKATPGAGLSLYITDIIISNGPVAGNVKLVEDTASAVDILEVMYFAANGGAVLSLKTPIKLTANKNLGVTSVSSTDHSVTVSGYIAP